MRNKYKFMYRGRGKIYFFLWGGDMVFGALNMFVKACCRKEIFEN
jgi:hypothetical protein